MSVSAGLRCEPCRNAFDFPWKAVAGVLGFGTLYQQNMADLVRFDAAVYGGAHDMFCVSVPYHQLHAFAGRRSASTGYCNVCGLRRDLYLHPQYGRGGTSQILFLQILSLYYILKVVFEPPLLRSCYGVWAAFMHCMAQGRIGNKSAFLIEKETEYNAPKAFCFGCSLLYPSFKKTDIFICGYPF